MKQVDYVLVDTPSVYCSIFYAMPQLNNSAGIQTQVVKGFDNFLSKIKRQFVGSKFIFAFEGGNNFRKKISSDYKSKRSKDTTSTVDSLKDQVKLIQKLLRLHGYPVISVEGYESDDIIGSLCKQLPNTKVIITTDKDMNQLLNKNVSIYNHRNNEYVTEETIIEKYGFSPESFVDYLSLVGDSSDNVKGVSGVGEKTATELLSKYGSVEVAEKHLSYLKPKEQKAVLSKEEYNLAKQLVTICSCVDIDDYDLEYKEVRHKELDAFYADLEIIRKPTKLEGALF